MTQITDPAQKQSKNRAAKPRLPLDAARVRSLALHYVGRYATTRKRLSDYLARKVRERGWNGSDSDNDFESQREISNIVEHCVALGYVNDEAFATARAASLLRRGYGASRVRLALSQAGIDAQQAQSASDIDPESALLAVHRFAKRKRIGPYARVEPDKKAHDRALAACLRAGHSFENARKVLESPRESLSLPNL